MRTLFKIFCAHCTGFVFFRLARPPAPRLLHIGVPIRECFASYLLPSTAFRSVQGYTGHVPSVTSPIRGGQVC